MKVASCHSLHLQMCPIAWMDGAAKLRGGATGIGVTILSGGATRSLSSKTTVKATSIIRTR